MKQTGTVVGLDGNMAKVECDRQSACSMCDNAEHCVEKCEKVYASALNTVNAKVGDIVEIETDTKKVLFSSFVVFVLPIILSIAAYFAASVFFGENTASIITFAVLISSMLVFSFVLNKRAEKKTVSRITRIY